MHYVRLANSEGSFFDAETGLTISRDDVVPLTAPIGRLTRERLGAGGLVFCDPPAQAAAATHVPDEPFGTEADTDDEGSVASAGPSGLDDKPLPCPEAAPAAPPAPRPGKKKPKKG